MKITLRILTLWILSSNLVNAQNYFGFLNNSRHTISTGINANPHLNANADYLVAFEGQGKYIERYGIVAQANFPLFSQKGFDFDFRLGAGMLLSFSDKFKSITGLSWNLSRSEDLNGRYYHSGFKIDFYPGYYGSKWVFTPHISLSYQPLINISHKIDALNAFRDLYPNNDGKYKAPKNGWFYQNNITLQTGITVAYFQPKWQINFTAGVQHQPNNLGIIALPDLGILPFYGGLNFGCSIFCEQ